METLRIQIHKILSLDERELLLLTRIAPEYEVVHFDSTINRKAHQQGACKYLNSTTRNAVTSTYKQALSEKQWNDPHYQEHLTLPGHPFSAPHFPSPATFSSYKISALLSTAAPA